MHNGHLSGMLAGSATIFFAYIGFDAVSTQSEEAKNPSRDVPIGIIASLIICTILYIAVASVLTGMVPYDKINIDAPVSDAFAQVGLPWAQFLIAVGALTGITSVLLVMMLSQPRVLLAMARDGLVPPGFFGAIHRAIQDPLEIDDPDRCLRRDPGGTPASEHPGGARQHRHAAGVLDGLRGRADHAQDPPRRPRPFKVPFMPLTPILGIVTCLVLDVLAARGELAATGRLARDRLRDLLYLRHSP